MIRVLEVIRQGQIGGGESHLLDLIRFLDKTQIEPICLSFSNGEMINQLRKMGIKCYIIETTKPFDVRIQKQIKQILYKEQIQLIHTHGSRAASNIIWKAKSLHIPIIYTVHGWSFHDDQPLIVKLLRAFCEKCICHFSDEVICVSKSNAETGRNVFGLKKCYVIENGVDLERFNPSAKYQSLRSDMHFTEDDFVIGFIARCTKQKNPIVYLKALEISHNHNKRIKGLFVGEGDMNKAVKDFIQSHQMDSYLYHSEFRTDIPELLQNIDAYCLPSLWEGLSIALLEAMAMEKAIIATPTDGTSEIITNKENGIIVPFNDVKSLASAINQLADSPEICRKYGKAAREIIEKRFNSRLVANAVTNIYKENVKTRRTN